MIELEHQILQEVNLVREGKHRRHLEPDTVLANVARAYSRLMAEEEFFSHHAPISGMEDLMTRVREAGGHFDAVGENLLMLPDPHAPARHFVESWLSSPGHRDNMLHPEWEVSGVGVAVSDSGHIFSTQLFGIPSAIVVDTVRLDTTPDTWFVIRAEMQIGIGHSLAAFVRNRFVASIEADHGGRAVLECEVPTALGRHHVAFGRRRSGSNDGWIGVHDGVVEISGAGRGSWHPSAPEPELVRDIALCRVSGSLLALILSGHAREPGVIVEDGRMKTTIAPGRFESRSEFRSGTGNHTIDVGIAQDSSHYSVVRRFILDTDSGLLDEE